MEAVQPADSVDLTTQEEPSVIHRFSFHGNAREYFGIWIVNLILTVLTLGIYSAWAKVRTNQYLYGNTDLAGDRFEYHAKPITILKGRLVALVFLAIYIFGDAIVPGVSVIILLLLMLFFPWIMVRSLAFRAVNSSWRGIRFIFSGSTKKSYSCSSKGGLITLITGGFAYPVALFWLKKFQVSNHRFGVSEFSLNADAGDYFKIYLKAWGLYILSIILVVALLFGLGAFTAVSEFAKEIQANEEFQQEQHEEYQYSEADEAAYQAQLEQATEGSYQQDASPAPSTGSTPAAGTSTTDPKDNVKFTALFVAAYVLFFGVFGLIFIYIKVRTLNLIWSGTHLGNKFAFNSALPLWGSIWLQLGNTVAILLSVGLLIPWAVIRTLRFRLSYLQIEGSANLDEFIADEAAQLDAAGEELGEAFDLDFGL